MRRDDTPRVVYLIVLIFWAIFCAVIFIHEQDLSIKGMVLFAVFSLWIFIRMAHYRGKYRPKFTFAFRILWLPMLVLFLILHALGEM